MNYIEHYKIDSEIFDYFDEGTKYDKDFNRRLHQFLIKSLNYNNGYLLDIGSGSGWITKYIKNRNNIILCDLSLKNLDKVKKNNEVNCLVADVLRLPIKDNQIDNVLISEVLEHLIDPLLAISEIYRITKPTGTIVISTPYKEKIQYYLCIHCNKKSTVNAHLRTFDEQVFKSYFSKLNIKNFKFYLFGNKIFLKSRLSYFLRFLPFRVWNLFDKIFNITTKKANNIIVIIKKK